MSEKDSEVVCYCQDIDKKTIVDSIGRGNNTLNLIREDTSACTGGNCTVNNPSGTCCSGDIMELVRLYSKAEESSSGCCSCCSS
jgi:NAD(P)H-nitrite reductase large subunit